MGTGALHNYSHRAREEGRERTRLSTRGDNHCFGRVVVEFKCVYCHPRFDVINALLHGEEEIWEFDQGPQISGVESHRRMSDEGESAF